MEPTTPHVQPLVAALTLDHRLSVIHAVAYTPRAFARQTAAVCRGRRVGGIGRCCEGIGEGVIVVRCGGGDHVGGGLGPTLVVCFEGVLRCAFCACVLVWLSGLRMA
jgi:hypothetical protein